MARPVLLLHGFTHTGSSWEPVVGALGERYRALTPDIRGHGNASERRPADLQGVLDDLAEEIEQVGAPSGSLTLTGYSMGGRLALHLALLLPDQFERLVLIGASPGIADDAERAARRRRDEVLATQIESSGLEDFARRWAQTPVLEGLTKDVARRVHEDRLRSTPVGLARALRGLGTGALPPLWDRLGELRMPVALVVGERDQKFQGIAGQMAVEMPRARLVVVSGAGHAVHLESPERVAAVIAGQ